MAVEILIQPFIQTSNNVHAFVKDSKNKGWAVRLWQAKNKMVPCFSDPNVWIEVIALSKRTNPRCEFACHILELLDIRTSPRCSPFSFSIADNFFKIGRRTSGENVGLGHEKVTYNDATCSIRNACSSISLILP
ncbi:hypothetical protein Thi970DRAFT_03209 [Thiorhodovibrio frisius]|uniref:Uncharacterized protein n=1 Tax=Thiorhodovibrio frisius TaxID=631362 RepID=H8Z655_9GAMM|nr:hypothetical protein Thi970DRAFT_03209 [Thiorhodovibrio frisius]WPL20412.1 hypothetical protein Thiofri_00502 [Thiorhodovibrio frisius]